MLKNGLKSALAALALLFVVSGQAKAETYVMDTGGSHAFIQFKIKHLGYSWLLGRFNTFAGTFEVDEKNPAGGKVEVTIETKSVDTNHAKRDKHLRSADFFEVDKYPQATFVSTGVKVTGEGKAQVMGNLTLKGVTKPVTLDVTHIGAGKDPWGGFRRGFEATTQIALADYGINFNLGPASKNVEIYISIEGKKQ